MSDDGDRLEPHPGVARILSEAPEGAVLLQGYVGPSTRPDHVALYLDLADLRHSISIPRAAIVHSEDAPTDVLPHGGTRVWVRRDARLIDERHVTPAAAARVFSGAIANQGPGRATARYCMETSFYTAGNCSIVECDD